MKLNNLKKFYLIFFSLILISIVVYALQAVTIQIIDVTEFSNTTNVSVPVTLNNNESIAGFQLYINHTPYLIFKEIQSTERMPNSTIETNDENGQLKIAVLIEDDIVPGNGTIMNIIFDIDESAIAGEYPLNSSEVIMADINTQTWSTESIQGIFTILVDSDGDGIDDSTDACPYTFGCSNYSGCSFGLKEWLPPITNQEEFDLQEGATLPLKFSAANCSNSFYSDEGINVRIYNGTLGIDKTYNASGEGSDYVRINETLEQYITNIHTNDLEMPLGNYIIYALFSNNLTYAYGFELVEKGSPNKGKGKGPK